MDTDVIKARRRYIRDNAPCESCGATLASCMAERGTDPEAPPWFGCCARGQLADIPCRHVQDSTALTELLKEIEAGHVRTVDEIKPKPRKRQMGWREYLDQDRVWKPDGRPMVAIADMDPEWRYNASRWLERRAARIASAYSSSVDLRLSVEISSPIGPSDTVADQLQADAWHEAHERQRDPVGWIRTTPLYRALVADLPDCSVALEAIAARAKHWNTCPARSGAGDCRCEELRAVKA